MSGKDALLLSGNNMPDPQPFGPGSMRPATPEELLETWKEIAAYLNRDQRTVKRWERSRGLPVHRLPGGPKAAGVYALKSEVDAWRQGQALNGEPAPHIQTDRRRVAVRWAAGSAVAALISGFSLWFFATPPRSPTPR